MSSFKRHFLSLIVLSASVVSVAPAQISAVTGTTSMAGYGPIVAPDSIAAVWGTGFSSATSSATGSTLPTTLSNVQVTIRDSAGMQFTVPLFMVSPGQINFLVPAGVAIGKATVTVAQGSTMLAGNLLVSNIAPGVFTANGTGQGVPAAQVQRVTAAGVSTFEMPFSQGTSSTTFVTRPINISTAGDRVYLILFLSGIRRHSGNPVIATIGGVRVPVLYAGPQSQFPGLDQINIGPLPTTLAAKGETDLIVTVDGVPANTTRINIQ